jgi:hypothetical protein
MRLKIDFFSDPGFGSVLAFNSASSIDMHNIVRLNILGSMFQIKYTTYNIPGK